MEWMGTVQGSFFRPAPYIDLSKPAGSTSISLSGYDVKWWKKYYTLQHILFSPNLVWLTLSILAYIVFPYDIASAKVWALDWPLRRFLLNSCMVLSYAGFWHVALYWLGWAGRKFNPSYTPSRARMIHNIYYTLWGVVVQTGWECIFMHLWATGKIPYIKDAEIFSSWPNFLRVVLWLVLVPIVRDFHFYFAHRFIHFRVLYKYIHSLHHRNTDVEPFSGLCMHPIEHLYYMTCMGVNLYFLMSPLHLLWNGFHLVLSPAASHSGWEDHWQADLYHYLHHSNFECNYGTTAVPLDQWFGTYRDKIGQSGTYKGGASEVSQEEHAKKALKSFVPSGPVSPADAVPTLQFFTYFVFTGILFVTLGWALANEQLFNSATASMMALFVSCGPLVVAALLWYYSGDNFSFLWPFHKEPLPALLFHAVASTLMCIIPVYHLIFSSLAPTSAYCRLWQC